MNTQERTSEEYMVARVLEQAKLSIHLPEDVENTENLGSSSGSSFSSFEISQTADASLHGTPETTDDAFEYIAGFIAKKFKSSNSELGDYTYKIKADHSYTLPSWVQQLSFGGLIKPSSAFLEKIKMWNKFFELYHGDYVRKDTLVVKKLH